MELTDILKERFLSVDPATVGHYINGGFMRPEMKPIRRDDKRMIGPAYTVRISGRDSCALYYGIKHAPKGSVIVIDRCGDQTFACCGEMVATYAQDYPDNGFEIMKTENNEFVTVRGKDWKEFILVVKVVSQCRSEIIGLKLRY